MHLHLYLGSCPYKREGGLGFAYINIEFLLIIQPVTSFIHQSKQEDIMPILLIQQPYYQNPTSVQEASDPV